MWIPGRDIFLDSGNAEGLCHTWDSASLFDSQGSSDSSFFSFPVMGGSSSRTTRTCFWDISYCYPISMGLARVS